MASYVVAGHPIGGASTTGLPEALHDLIQTNGVGATITITLTGPIDTLAKGHGAIK